MAKIDRALEPPVSLRVNNRPAWYGDDEDAWSQFQAQMRS